MTGLTYSTLLFVCHKHDVHVKGHLTDSIVRMENGYWTKMMTLFQKRENRSGGMTHANLSHIITQVEIHTISVSLLNILLADGKVFSQFT